MTVILGTFRDWLASALQGVLEGEDIVIVRASDMGELAEASRRPDVDGVILDEKLHPDGAPSAIRELLDGPLPSHVPLLVYSSDRSDRDLHVRALDAGAWGVVEEPVRSHELLATLRRLADLGARMGGGTTAGRDGFREIPAIEDLLQRLPVVEALARREQVGLALVALGPTYPGEGDVAEKLNRRLAGLCLERLRKSDLFATFEAEGEVAVVAYATTREGARTLAERLAAAAAKRSEIRRPEDALSAGIVEISPDQLPEDLRAGSAPEGETRLLSAARRALEEARKAGGGVRFAS